MCKEKQFSSSLLFAIEMTALNVFLAKKDYGPLGVKIQLKSHIVVIVLSDN